ncbi:MAG: triphosphoribosyl-dephospho-CoA synthase [Azoarcus sp.]|nr:triphosphoribosyl-dephospho-CoA synthase [Azoarcus sp.]
MSADGVSARIARGRAAFLWACGLDVAVRKPGNVSTASPGHAMEAAQFLASARAAADPLFARGRPVGERIEAAVVATRAAVGCNTNLGILLLCAPLAAALEHLPIDVRDDIPGKAPGLVSSDAAAGVSAAGNNGFAGCDPVSLRMAVRSVLAALDVDDARAAYRAIALANPGGLGRAESQDVSALPEVTLRAAMALAAERDSVARQYADGYAEIFDEGLATLCATTGPLAAAVQTLFLGFLAGRPDSHIVRKLGLGVAQTVTAEAAEWHARLQADPAAGETVAFAQWDEALKRAGINPGTSADLTVCTLFAAALIRPGAIGMASDQTWHGMCIHHIGIGLFPTSDTRITLPPRRAW